ncbi:hypothetical protein [Streptomyces himalayensis]|uniref:Uncharacterized protein n=1 Tax=Streptomyces himalayensis subsp. himalayensis TaxID=2756131 RepID=A0A7W0DTF3_9ACTN|nr:hypothetical protein [Streptomyces himalayensis]MBA2950443.1 hypothetical protein [Streptomyces himalayensis subsp. himalayensis]
MGDLVPGAAPCQALAGASAVQPSACGAGLTAVLEVEADGDNTGHVPVEDKSPETPST